MVCILCGKENDEMFCDKCQKEDVITRLAAHQRYEKATDILNKERYQVLRGTIKLNTKDIINKLKTVKSLNKNYIGGAIIFKHFTDRVKKIQKELETKLKNRERIKKEIEKMKNQLKTETVKRRINRLTKSIGYRQSRLVNDLRYDG